MLRARLFSLLFIPIVLHSSVSRPVEGLLPRLSSSLFTTEVLALPTASDIGGDPNLVAQFIPGTNIRVYGHGRRPAPQTALTLFAGVLSEVHSVSSDLGERIARYLNVIRFNHRKSSRASVQSVLHPGEMQVLWPQPTQTALEWAAIFIEESLHLEFGDRYADEMVAFVKDWKWEFPKEFIFYGQATTPIDYLDEAHASLGVLRFLHDYGQRHGYSREIKTLIRAETIKVDLMLVALGHFKEQLTVSGMSLFYASLLVFQQHYNRPLEYPWIYPKARPAKKAETLAHPTVTSDLVPKTQAQTLSWLVTVLQAPTLNALLPAEGPRSATRQEKVEYLLLDRRYARVVMACFAQLNTTPFRGYVPLPLLFSQEHTRPTALPTAGSRLLETRLLDLAKNDKDALLLLKYDALLLLTLAVLSDRSLSMEERDGMLTRALGVVEKNLATPVLSSLSLLKALAMTMYATEQSSYMAAFESILKTDNPPADEAGFSEIFSGFLSAHLAYLNRSDLWVVRVARLNLLDFYLAFHIGAALADQAEKLADSGVAADLVRHGQILDAFRRLAGSFPDLFSDPNPYMQMLGSRQGEWDLEEQEEKHLQAAFETIQRFRSHSLVDQVAPTPAPVEKEVFVLNGSFFVYWALRLQKVLSHSFQDYYFPWLSRYAPVPYSLLNYRAYSIGRDGQDRRLVYLSPQQHAQVKNSKPGQLHYFKGPHLLNPLSAASRAPSVHVAVRREINRYDDDLYTVVLQKSRKPALSRYLRQSH